MATIYIDNKPYEVKDGQNLLRACLSLGFDIPYFCWHPALHSAGACRQCAVKQFRDEKDTRGRIVMSCMTPVTDGLRISIDDPEVKVFRKSILELLMTNHPHDCPVCDEGGECHLQDMTVMTGHVSRRFRFRKRTHRNQYLGPFINHEMDRCIQCYRCVRFYRDYAGGRDLAVLGSHHHVYFGRHEDGVLENEFSGNLIEVCPTGVFTDKTLKKHYARKWDLQTAPSICVHCSLGCNTIPGERYGILRRVHNRYNHAVNGYFLCDRGRFGYEFVNSVKRIRRPFLKSKIEDRAGTHVSKQTILKHIAGLLHFGADVIGIGSPRASLEANFLLRELVGPERFYAGISENDFRLISAILEILQNGPVSSASLQDVREADAVFILGEDLTNTAPMLALAVRQSVRMKSVEVAAKLQIPEWLDAAVRTAAQNEQGPLFIAATDSTRLDDKAALIYRGAPEDIARLGFAVAMELNSNAPKVADLPEELLSYARTIAKALHEARKPVVISGTSCGSSTVIQAAANIVWALNEKGAKASLCYVVPECNSLGMGLLGGRSLDEAFDSIKESNDKTVIILENDLFRRANQDMLKSFFGMAKNVLVLDHISSATVDQADIVLPAATYAEATGTMVNNEGRCQRSFAVFPPEKEIQSSWQWLRDILVASGRARADAWKNFDDITNALADAIPAFRHIRETAPASGFRISGMKIPRQPHRYSGRTAMHSDKDVHEQKPADDPDTALSFSMEGYEGRPPAALIPRFWVPQWNSVQAVTKFQKEAGGELYGGAPGIRLIEPDNSLPLSYYACTSSAFIPRNDELFILARYHIFGSEELSALSPAIAELSPKPYLALSMADAGRYGISEGEIAELTLAGTLCHLPVTISRSLPLGLGCLPAGLTGLNGIDLPAWASIRKSRVNL